MLPPSISPITVKFNLVFLHGSYCTQGCEKHFSALHRWGIHVAQNMKWALADYGSNVTGGDSTNLLCCCLLLSFSKSRSRALKMVVPRFGIKSGISIKWSPIPRYGRYHKPSPQKWSTVISVRSQAAAVWKARFPGQHFQFRNKKWNGGAEA